MLAVAVALSLAAGPLDTVTDLHGSDKVLHAGVCGAITLAGYGAMAALDAPLAARIGAGAGAAIVAGLAKEGADAAGFGTPSLGDLAFDALGIGAGIGVALAVDAVVRDE
jgi:hypothetical protein